MKLENGTAKSLKRQERRYKTPQSSAGYKSHTETKGRRKEKRTSGVSGKHELIKSKNHHQECTHSTVYIQYKYYVWSLPQTITMFNIKIKYKNKNKIK